MRSRIIFLAKAAVSLGLLGVALHGVALGELATAVLHANPVFLGLALVSHGIGLIVSTARWQILLGIQTIDMRFRDTLQIYWIGAFFNTILPSTIGGDVIKGYLMAQRRGRPMEVVTTVIADRMAGLAALFVMAVIGFLWLAADADAPWPWFGALGAMMLLSRPSAGPRTEGARRLLWTSVAALGDATRRYAQRRQEFLAVVGLSLLLQANVIVCYYSVARALRLDISIAHLCLLVPPVLVLSMIPVSLGGLGVREVAVVALFAPLGLPPAELVAFSLVSYGLMVVVASGGGVVYALSSRNSPRTPFAREGYPVVSAATRDG